MKTRPSLVLIWSLTALIVIAFFLPWARLAPDAAGSHVLSLAQTLATGEEDIISSYLWMKRAEARAALRRPAEGTSGYQLVADPETGGGGVGSAVIELLNLGPWIRLVAAVPVLAIILALLLTFPPASRQWPLAVALLLAGIYAAIRWKLNNTYTERILLHIELNAGVWIFLLATALLVGVTLITLMLPKKWNL